MTLKDGKVGEVFIIKDVGASPLKPRLMSMGLVKGTEVSVLPSAPLGDPMAIRIRSYNLALRLEDAEKITVERVG